MNTIKSKLEFLILAATAFVIIGCGDAGQIERFEEERSAYENRISKIIADIDSEIAELHNELVETTEEEREELYMRLEALEEARTDLNNYLQELRVSAHDEWEDLRSEIDQAMEDVENRLQELIARI